MQTSVNLQFLARFPKQLGYWSLHCTLNALPSFYIALVGLNLAKQPVAIVAMLAAIATFIVLYATLTSLPGPLEDRSSLLSRALWLGTKIRTWIACLSLLLVPVQGFFLMPDFWCGWAAVIVQNWIVDSLGLWRHGLGIDRGGDSESFFAVYATTMLEGFIISFLLLFISFCVLLVLQAKERRRAFAEALER
ncbi:hypothetical protein OKA04_08470 [Luteolibacter flavescens]|uniref:Transmembrane protein n=1 Tax=Luteolibacter flavescens TaxID=1859460 RepID=A0ABT3FMG1_9BACT|nr:hypothetical protein [Luteolibacter flavescens]MCW1884760.1 hypothetical protein [Luteolibacter flavescens]